MSVNTSENRRRTSVASILLSPVEPHASHGARFTSLAPSKVRWQRRITSVLLRDAQFAHGEFSSRTLADRAFRRVKSTPSKGKDRDRMGEAKRRRQQPAEAAFILGLRDARFTLSDREDVKLTIAGSFRS
jgi:hypothetical protein